MYANEKNKQKRLYFIALYNCCIILLELKTHFLALEMYKNMQFFI